MTNKSFWGWVLSAVLILAGCSRAESEIVLFRDEVQTITVSYWEAGEETTWGLEQSDIAGVMEWAEGLDLEHKTFAEGNSPGDADGGTFYDFRVNDGDAAFSYVNAAGSYVVCDGEWYEVENPADPPIGKPDTETDKIPNQVRFGDRMVDADTLSEETLRWIDWYNSLPEEDQLKVSAVPPDLIEASGLASTEDAEASAAAE